MTDGRTVWEEINGLSDEWEAASSGLRDSGRHPAHLFRGPFRMVKNPANFIGTVGYAMRLDAVPYRDILKSM